MTHHVFSKPRSGPAVRLRLKPKAPPTGYVDGAWWPYSGDLMGELPQLLRILSVRLGSIDRITYRLSEWSTDSRRILFLNRLTHLNWSLSQPSNTISVEGADGARLTLLIVPPDIEALPAHTAMMAAAAPGNTTAVAQLLPANRTEFGTLIDTFAAQNQWDSEGGAQNVAHRDQCGAVSASA